MNKFTIISLGCAKNLVDSERIISFFINNDFVLVPEIEEADLIVCNTCSFIELARKEAADTLVEIEEKMKEDSKLLIAGCLLSNYYYEVKGLFPKAILIDKDQLENIDQELKEYYPSIKNPISLERVITANYRCANVRIADGCNHKCGYCAIPGIRGEYKSRTVEDITNEIELLSSKGVVEITLLAQDTTYYGIDLYQEYSLSKLLDKVASTFKNINFRLLYLYPSEITDDLLLVFKKYDNIYKYFDIPLQHFDKDILKSMNRPNVDIKELLKRIRTEFKDVVLRTTLIVGYPGESNEKFNYLISKVKEYEFDHLGCFEYSREKETTSYKLNSQINHKTKKQRYHALMNAQKTISRIKRKKLKNKEMMIIIDEIEPEIVGHSYYNVETKEDGLIYVETLKEHQIGDQIKVKITDALIYDLIAKEID